MQHCHAKGNQQQTALHKKDNSNFLLKQKIAEKHELINVGNQSDLQQ